MFTLILLVTAHGQQIEKQYQAPTAQVCEKSGQEFLRQSASKGNAEFTYTYECVRK